MPTLVAIVDRIADGARGALEPAGRYLLAIVQALLILIAARLALGYLRGQVARLLARTEATPYAVAVVQQLVSVSVYFVAFSIALAAFGANWSGVLTFLTITSVAVALSIQDVLKNLIAGVALLIERPFAPGETIRVKEQAGTVDRVSLRATHLRTEAGEHVIVPNALVYTEIVLAPPAGVTRTAVVVSGIAAELTEIGAAVQDALAGVPSLERSSPRVSFRRVGSAGTEVAVTLWHGGGEAVVPIVLQRLRERFPDAELAVEEG